MRIKPKFNCFLYLLVFFNLNISITIGSETDTSQSIEIPIFHKGYNVKKIYDSSESTKSVTYHVRTEYPATEVLEFYDSYFNARGWISSFEICQRHWDGFNDGNKTIAGLGRQLFASWEHPQGDLQLVLWLKYEPSSQGEQQEVFVECQLQPKLNK